MKKFLVAALFLGAMWSLPAHAQAARNTLTWVDNSNGDSQEQFVEVERKIIPNPVPLTNPVVCGGTVSGTYAKIGQTSGPDITTFADTTVSPGNTYCYRVRAVNATAMSAYSNEAGRYVPFTAPVAPSNLTVSP